MTTINTISSLGFILRFDCKKESISLGFYEQLSHLKKIQE